LNGKIFGTLLLALCLPATVMAQVVPGDPSDAVYQYMDRWETLGYLPPGYLFRPASPEVVREALQRVASLSDGTDRIRAERFLSELGVTDISPQLVHRSTARVSTLESGNGYRGESGAALAFLGNLRDTLWLSGSVGAVYADPLESVQPVSERYAHDVLSAGFDSEERTVYYGLDSVFSLGSPDLWTSLSYARSSVGPFFTNGIVLGPQAQATPNWSVHGRFGSFRISSSLHQLTAAKPSATGFTTLQFNKYLAFHVYSLSIGDRLDLGLYEAAVWAGEFKPLYLVPFSFLYLLQSTAGFSDNSLIGLYASWRPADGFMLKASCYADDVDAKGILTSGLDNKIIGAAQFGSTWAPRAGSMTLVSFNYTAVFPYMYAHWEDHYTPYAWTADGWGREWLQNNYTHAGQGIGSSLLPDSDRLELKADFSPLDSLGVQVLTRFMRHGNASEGIPGDKGGGLFDDGRVDSLWSYQPPFAPATVPQYFRFLTQQTLDTAFQVGISSTYALKIASLRLDLGARYVFEQRWNADLVPGASMTNHYVGIEATLSL